MILAAASGPGQTCLMPRPTEINVTPETEEVRFDASRTIAQMQGAQSDTINPYGFHSGMAATQGLMKGSIALRYVPKIKYEIDQATGTACVWYDSIDVEFRLTPVVMIAKEVHADRCMREAVTAHEMKHVRADRMIVNKYARAMGEKLYTELAGRGFVAGPVPASEATAVVARMQDTVRQIMELEQRKMEIERIETQRAIDNLAEYDAVNGKCPDFKVTISKNR